MIIQFSADITPISQARPRVVNRHAFEPKRVAEYKKAVHLIGRSAMVGRLPFNQPVRISLSFRRNRPSTSRTFGDIDNLIKAVLDALNGVCYSDDALVVEIHAFKMQSDREGVDVTVQNISSEECST